MDILEYSKVKVVLYLQYSPLYIQLNQSSMLAKPILCAQQIHIFLECVLCINQPNGSSIWYLHYSYRGAYSSYCTVYRPTYGGEGEG